MPLAIPQICPADRPFSSVDIRHNQIEPDRELIPARNLRSGAVTRASPSLRCPNCPLQRKKPRAMPGALILSMTARSVLRDDRAAELVVHADGDEIDVLTDAIGTEERASRRGEAVGAILHEQVIVLDRGRPV